MVKAQSVRERLQRTSSRPPATPLFEVTNHTDADPGPIREIGLGQAAADPGASEKLAEAAVPPVVHRRLPRTHDRQPVGPPRGAPGGWLIDG
ncbi:hypothetical protein TPA0908_42240 [Micromonospora sp. AKA38]|nr:hypothetical protein TPA0908_42240 [Micromonospora sp. AKA38]